MRHLIGLLSVDYRHYGLHCCNVMLAISDFGNPFEATRIVADKGKALWGPSKTTYSIAP